MKASEIIARFGSIAELSRELGAPISTVSSWGMFNQIPQWRQAKLLELAAAKGIALATDDFPLPDERVKRGEAA